jgi:hypothetical protein
VKILFLLLLVLACISGCGRNQSPQTASEKIDSLNPLTEAQVQQVKQKLNLLKPGIREKQVFATLGIPDYIQPGQGSGMIDNLCVIYQLNQNHNLLINYDCRDYNSRSNQIVIGVRLDRESWSKGFSGFQKQ